MPVEARFDEALRILARHGAEIIVVGGIAAVLQGSPLTTEYVDVLYLASEENCRRLVSALDEMDAHYADPAGRRIKPDARRLASGNVRLLKTSCGRVDLMRTIGDDLGYRELLGRTLQIDIGVARLPTLELDAIIETQEQADRPKDRFQLPYLRQLLPEIQRSEDR